MSATNKAGYTANTSCGWVGGAEMRVFTLSNSITMDEQTDGRTDGRTDSPCVLQDFVPFGAAALLPINLHHFLLKQGTGTTDHLLPLGCY